jgi:guanylate kinase
MKKKPKSIKTKTKASAKKKKPVSKKGRIFVITGPSGVGKTAIRDGVLLKEKNFEKIITCTTRAPREGEKDGVDYHFFSKEKFIGLLNNKSFFESALVYGNYYGSLKKEVSSAINSGKNVLFTVDVQGALSIKKNYPKSVVIFIKPPTIDDLKKRLLGRGKDSEEIIEKRLAVAEKEIALMGKFDFVVVNDILDDAIFETVEIINDRYKKIQK